MATEAYEVIFSGKLGGNFVQNILHVNVEVAVVNPYETARELLLQMNAAGAVQELWVNMLPVDYTMTSLRARRILPTGGPTAIILQDSLYEQGGQRAGEISVASNAPLIIWLPTTDPAKTGRTFLPGVSETDIANGVLDSGLITDIQAFMTLWVTGDTFNTSDTWQGAIKRKGPPQTAATLFAGRISPIVGNQRRRQKPI